MNAIDLTTYTFNAMPEESKIYLLPIIIAVIFTVAIVKSYRTNKKEINDYKKEMGLL